MVFSYINIIIIWLMENMYSLCQMLWVIVEIIDQPLYHQLPQSQLLQQRNQKP